MLNHNKILSYFILLSFLASFQPLRAQEMETRPSVDIPGARPDIPGMLGIEFGWVMVPDFPQQMKLNFLGSVTFSPYYKYEIPLGNSGFSIHPGIAFTSEKFSFKENITVISSPTTSGYVTQLIGLDSLFADATIKKSKLNATYFEIPLEITFRTNHELPKRSFNITVGAKGGVLLDAKTKYTYRQDGQTKKSKQKEKYDLNTWRVILVGKVGYGSVNLFYNYNFLPLFNGDKGPLGTEAQQMSFGISLDLF
jgi:hypothetical protein